MAGVSITVVLMGLLAVYLFPPTAFGQTFNRDQTQEYLQEIELVMSAIQNHYVKPVDAQTLLDGAIKGMFETLNDPYSVYLDDDFLQDMNDTTEGRYGGVGIYISHDHYDPENPAGRLPYVRVVAPIEGTPSWKAGVNAGDYIYAIERESAKGFTTQDVADRLRGKPGSSVTVTFLRNKSVTFDLVLTREIIEIPTAKSTVIDSQIGYLRIIQFTPYTEPQVRNTLREFNSQGLKQLIIDVRNNPGGLLDSVVKVADLFFSDGIIVSTKYRHQSNDLVHRANQAMLVPRDVEIVVLIDKGSASASEILTGALKDRGRSTVIGEKSFGKGSIQQLIQTESKLPRIKLTTGHYYTPAGNNIDKTGIAPNIVVEEPVPTEEQIEAFAVVLQENRISAFIEKYPNPTQVQINNFVATLHAEGLMLKERSIRILIKRELEKHLNTPPVVDLEFDRFLIRAVNFLKHGE